MTSIRAAMRNTGIALALGASALSAATDPAAAITSPEFRYSTPRTGYYSIGPMHLTPDSYNSSLHYYIAHGTLFSSDGCYMTGVQLPQGATILDVLVYYRSDDKYDISVQLDRLNLATGVNQHAFRFVLPDDTKTRKSTTIIVPTAYRTVNNTAFAYAFQVCMADDTTFSGARIRYTYTNAGE